jgi:hypothetical protein
LNTMLTREMIHKIIKNKKTPYPMLLNKTTV